MFSLKVNSMQETIVGFWNERKEKLKQKYPAISDDDLCFSEGKEKEMVELLGYKLGKSEEEVRVIINSLK
jgi:hypothetical protein